jgi:cholest-4-en-3-one 26-monooxygenase
MASPTLPPGFDFTDPDIYAHRLPVQEFAELRATARIWWNEQPPGQTCFPLAASALSRCVANR